MRFFSEELIEFVQPFIDFVNAPCTLLCVHRALHDNGNNQTKY